jgi:hypothetical protein
MNFKSVLMLFLAVFLTVSFAYAKKDLRLDKMKQGKPLVCPATKEYNVGDRGPANGWIIYKKPAATGQSADTCWQYLEAAPVDSVKKVWSNVDNKLLGGTGTGIGEGQGNTKKIMDQANHKDSAAKACDDFVVKFDGKTFDDWFLPSKDELELMYLTLKKKNIGEFKNQWYWSSSEYVGVNAWNQSFNSGNQFNYDKYYGNNVRCARAF